MHTNRHSPQSEGGAFVGLDWDLGRNPAKQALRSCIHTDVSNKTYGQVANYTPILSNREQSCRHHRFSRWLSLLLDWSLDSWAGTGFRSRRTRKPAARHPALAGPTTRWRKRLSVSMRREAVCSNMQTAIP